METKNNFRLSQHEKYLLTRIISEFVVTQKNINFRMADWENASKMKVDLDIADALLTRVRQLKDTEL